MLAALSVVVVLIGGVAFTANNTDVLDTASTQEPAKVEYVAQAGTQDQAKL